MKITPINILIPNFNDKELRLNNRFDGTQGPVLRAPLKADTVCFKASVPPDIVTLKKLLAYNIPDMYTGRIMVDPRMLESILQKKLFSRPLKTVVKILDQFKDSYFPVEQEIYNMVCQDAKKYPRMKLEESLHRRIPKASVELREKQMPIFEELIKEAQNLPPEQLEKFNELMATTLKKIHKKSVTVPFSAKELRYKLERITEEIKIRGINKEIKIMRTVTGIAKNMPERIRTTYFDGKIVSQKGRKKQYRDNTRQIAGYLGQIEKLILFSSLAGDKELNNVLKNAKLKLYGIPLIEPFSRKSFIYELKKILNALQDEKLERKMEKIAVKLPTAKEEVSAFIMKSALNSSEKIGYDMLANSVGTAEHLLPQIHGGLNYLSNLGLASFAANGERAHRKMPNQIKKHPETYENCQKYVDRLIELYHNGTLKKLGIGKYYITGFAEKMRKMSPVEKPMILDLSKL